MQDKIPDKTFNEKMGNHSSNLTMEKVGSYSKTSCSRSWKLNEGQIVEIKIINLHFSR